MLNHLFEQAIQYPNPPEQATCNFIITKKFQFAIETYNQSSLFHTVKNKTATTHTPTLFNY
ncbi:hypothetical protein L3049_16505 [Labilibaculum sp. DW002]|uniref:Uncharacterized protein n=1 Tax=Paralabilibaculum antarcticum TaxID=2912572 RepID=A0ABT5VZ61_9BACT|nr:hypothetical protein [Labilibaculum sp. DW002]MDE5419594.1 hypothetical protein [Labilibaculum sp. DW002]